MTVLSNASSRVFIKNSVPGSSEPGVEQGNFWLDTLNNNLYVNSVPTVGFQVWEAASIGSITQYNALIGGSANNITSIPPTATTGVPLVSNGAAANPTFTTASVAGGGTGATTLTGVLTGNGTSPVTATPVVEHDVLIGGATNTITSVPPSATSGVALVSTGAVTDPTFGTVVVQGGGSGATTLTGVLSGNGTSPFTASSVVQHDVLVGGVSNAITSISPSTSGFVLTSNGVASDPSFQANSAANAIITITGNSGGPESASANNFNILGTGSITVAGTANTETVQLTGLTTNNVLVGAGTATITNVPPTATLGIPLVSNGAAVDPSFSTASVAGGGTGATTLTGVLTGNGTSAVTASPVTQFGAVIAGASNAVTSVSPTATTGVPLVSNGVAANPTFSTASVAGGGTGATTLTGVLTGNGTSAVTASPVTQFAALIGGGSNTVSSSSPTATTGVPLVSNGVASDPTFGTASVAGGGTGVTSTTAYAVLCGGTTSTNPIQSIASVGTSGQVLKSNGAGALPTFQNTPAFMAFLNANSTALTAATTYTFSTGLPGAPGVTTAYDVTSSFASATGLFTAPVTGRYRFMTTWTFAALAGGATNGTLQLVPSTANRLFQSVVNIGGIRTGTNTASLTCIGDIDMASGDTMKATYVVTGSSASTVTGSTTAQTTFFSGSLITTQ
jgi:hypothetical protein